VIEDQADWHPQSGSKAYWSKGLLREQLSWTDMPTCSSPYWAGLVIAAPTTDYDDIRDSSFRDAWSGLLPGVSIQVVVNTPALEQAIVEFFPNPLADMVVIVHLYTKEYFQIYENQHDELHPCARDPWLDMLRYCTPGLIDQGSSHVQRSLTDRLAAGELKVRASQDARAPQEVYLLNRRPGQLTTEAAAFELPRMS
jgi:hypothetical protein